MTGGTPVRQKRGTRAKEEGSLPEEPRRAVSAGEINRELTVLKRLFSLAVQAGKLVRKPHFPMLRENNVRVGFFEREQYLSVLRHLPTSMLAHQGRQRRVLVRACDRAQRLLPCVVPGPDRRRLPGQHPARLSPNRRPEHGPRRHPRTRGDEIERSQDSQRFRSL
jgi:hypothetical protein